MTTQIISHNADNQLFADLKEALQVITRNGYKVAYEATTLPCSFDERQRSRHDYNYDDEVSIRVFVVEDADVDSNPLLIGYRYSHVVRDAEAGNVITYAESMADGLAIIEEYEEEDRKEGTYTPSFYECVELDETINL